MSEQETDVITRQTMDNIGRKAYSRAPVDTGLLRSTMITGIHRSKTAKTGVWDMEQLTDYTLVQEFNHPVHGHFITRSFVEEREPLKKALEERFKKRDGIR